MKRAKLIMVTSSNNNKYYELIDKGDGTFDAEYGRVGANPQRRNYPMSQWDKKYNEKVKKGYVDNTELFAIEESDTDAKVTVKKNDGFNQKRSTAVISIIKKLQAWANKSIQTNYTVSSEAVTQKQIDEAQTLIDEMVPFKLTKDTIVEFNEKLLKFYTVVPRKMKHVRDHLIDSSLKGKELEDRKNQIISEEQDTLDVMAGQVKLNTSSDEPVDTKTTVKDVEPKDILDISELDVEVVTDDAIIDMVKDKMQGEASRLVNVYSVVNRNTQKAFDEYVNNSDNKTTELLWHGSRNENWWSILTTGLKIRPSNAVHTGSMFGDGIYGANKCKKSMGYTSIRGSYWSGGSANEAVLALYDFHTGKQKIIKRHDSSCYNLNYNVMKKEGFDSVYAKGGIDLINDEFITYHSDQTTIKYLVVIK